MARPPRSLLLPVETRAREFDGKLLLALHAAERGWNVVLGERHTLHYALPEFPHSVYFSKGFRSGNREMFPIIAGYGHRIVALDEEALLRFSDDIFRLKMDPVVQGCVDALFAWGEDDAALYRSLPGMQGIRVIATGNPRIDMMRPTLRAYFQPAIDDLHERFGRFALLNSNFAIANHFIANKTRFKVAQSVDDDTSADLKSGTTRHKAALLAAFLAALPRIAGAVAPDRLVVRPHPSENAATWQEAARGLDNVQVLHEGSVIPWLAAATVLLHNGCTSAVEAAVIGTPAIAFRPEKSERFDHALPNDLSRECTDVAGLEALVRDAMESARAGRPRTLSDAQRSLLAAHLTALEGPLACENLMDAIDAVERAPHRRMATAAGPLATRIRHARFRRRHRRDRGAGATGKKADYTRHKFPPIALDEVRQRARALGQAIGRANHVSIDEISANLFRVVAG